MAQVRAVNEVSAAARKEPYVAPSALTSKMTAITAVNAAPPALQMNRAFQVFANHVVANQVRPCAMVCVSTHNPTTSPVEIAPGFVDLLKSVNKVHVYARPGGQPVATNV